MKYINHLREFGELVREIIEDSINYYINHKRAQFILNNYSCKINYRTSSGIANDEELKALEIVSDCERIQENRREMRIRLRRLKKTAW